MRDRVVEAVHEAKRVRSAESPHPQRQARGHDGRGREVEAPGGPAAPGAGQEEVEGERQEGRGDGILLGQEAGHEGAYRQGVPGRGGAAPRRRGAAGEEPQDASERAGRRQELGPADHGSQHLRVNRMKGEQEGRHQRGVQRRRPSRRREEPPRQGEHRERDQHVQEEIGQAVAERVRPADGVVQGEGEDGEGTVEARHRGVADAPVSLREVLGNARQVPDQLVLLDDAVIVVDETGNERR